MSCTSRIRQQTYNGIGTFLVDSFTKFPLAGNPAGVVVLQNEASKSWMSKISQEFNAPVTAFVYPKVATKIVKPNSYHINWFTPTCEINLCGHASLAAAHVLFDSDKSFSNKIQFSHVVAGNLEVVRNDDASLTIRMPAAPPAPFNMDEKLILKLKKALGLKDDDNFIYVGFNGSDLIIELDDITFSKVPSVVDYQSIKEFGFRGVVICCSANHQPHMVGSFGASILPTKGCCLRAFYPMIGINEDFATGSALCALTPYLCAKLDIAIGCYIGIVQLSTRKGVSMARLHRSQEGSLQVEITTNCCTISAGTLVC